jgi:hypothetical protein
MPSVFGQVRRIARTARGIRSPGHGEDYPTVLAELPIVPAAETPDLVAEEVADGFRTYV